MIIQLFVTCLMYADSSHLAQGIQLDPVPADNQYFLQNPSSFDVDEKGNYYLLDFRSKVVFIWDKNGAFIRTICQPGNGPGEFTFRGANGTGFLSVAGDRLFVFDGWKTSVQIFELNGTYIKSTPLISNRSRALDFAVTREGQFILLLRHAREDGRYLIVETFDSDGNSLNTLASMKDTSYEIRLTDKQKQVTIMAFHPTLVTSFNGRDKQIIIGNSQEPSFQVFDMSSKSCTIKAPLKRLPVTHEDIAELEEVHEKKRLPPTLIFPDHKPCYTHLHSLGNKGFLAYTQSPSYGKISGIYLDRQGQVKGRFKLDCGIGGGLLGNGDRVLNVLLTPEGEFVLRELIPL